MDPVVSDIWGKYMKYLNLESVCPSLNIGQILKQSPILQGQSKNKTDKAEEYRAVI